MRWYSLSIGQLSARHIARHKTSSVITHMSDPAIEHYTVEHVPNPNPAGDVSWQIYHTVRNAVLQCCKQFGPSGPMGECPITDASEPPQEWPVGDPHPIDYFVVDDQYNHKRYVYVEVVRPTAFMRKWLLELVRAMGQFPGWGVGVMAFEKAYILAFGDRLMVTGEIFAACTDFVGVVHSGQHALATMPKPGSV